MIDFSRIPLKSTPPSISPLDNGTESISPVGFLSGRHRIQRKKEVKKIFFFYNKTRFLGYITNVAFLKKRGVAKLY